MNIFNGKVVAIKDGQFGPWTPGLQPAVWCAPVITLSPAR